MIRQREKDSVELMPVSKSRWRGALVNVAVLTVSTLLVAAIAEAVFRYRFGPGGYNPPDTVLDIQQHLVTQPDYGFAWRPNVNPEENIRFDVADVAFEPLSTDAFGFINHPGAVADRARGMTVDVLGLGDSFVEHAAHAWYEIAKARGFAYHSLALHRTAPPQYARIFESHGVDMRPIWVVVGVFENDFLETTDYWNWTASGLDWFAYHSGTWCGPPADDSLAAHLLNGPLQGWHALYRNVRNNMRGDRMSVGGPSETEVKAATNALESIVESADEIEARVLFVLIPSKPTVFDKSTPEAIAYDTMITTLRTATASDVLDLRDPFRSHDDPRSLYYEVDGHWNHAGMELAGRIVFDFIEAAESNQ